MDNVVAYTMLVPDGWQFQGHVEWSKDKTPYPQRVIKVTAVDGSWVNFSPALSFFLFDHSRSRRRHNAPRDSAAVESRRVGGFRGRAGTPRAKRLQPHQR